MPLLVLLSRFDTRAAASTAIFDVGVFSGHGSGEIFHGARFDQLGFAGAGTFLSDGLVVVQRNGGKENARGEDADGVLQEPPKLDQSP